MKIENAYWISPRGALIPVTNRHINTVIDNPKKFGLTKEYIEDVYKKHNEPIHHEGNAREEIIENLMRTNWIRIRLIPKKDQYTIQLNKLTKKAKDYIFDFAVKMTKSGASKYGEVRITTLDGRPDIVGDFDDVLTFDLFECDRKHELSFTLIEDFINDNEVIEITQHIYKNLF